MIFQKQFTENMIHRIMISILFIWILIFLILLTGCKSFSCKEIIARLPDAFNAGMQGYQNTDTRLRLNNLESQNIANQK